MSPEQEEALARTIRGDSPMRGGNDHSTPEGRLKFLRGCLWWIDTYGNLPLSAVDYVAWKCYRMTAEEATR